MKIARGFTLLELMITVALLGILAALAAPSFNSLIQSSRLTASANELVAALQMARMEAIRTNSRVEVCPSTNGSSCAGSDWRRVIVLRPTTTPATVVRDVAMEAGSLSAVGSGNVTATTINRIWFMADGFVRTGSLTAPTQVATIGICTTRLSKDNARDVRINVSRISVEKATRATCAAPTN